MNENGTLRLSSKWELDNCNPRRGQTVEVDNMANLQLNRKLAKNAWRGRIEMCQELPRRDTRRVSAVTNNKSTTTLVESLVQLKIWKRNSLDLFFPAVNSWRIEMLVIECNPWSGRVPSWKQKHDFKNCNFIALCLILRWSHSKPGVPARSPPLSQRHSKQSLLWTSFFNTTFLPILRMMYLMYSGPWRHRIYVNTAHHHHWQSHSHEHLRQHMLTEQACRSKWTIPREEQI